jgi:hypothetical protein
MHLAQLNIATPVAPPGSPELDGFMSRLEEINGLADRSPGFVWRLVGDDGDDATGLRPYGPDVMVNLSVWESVESLREFTYRTGHLELMRSRRQWFRTADGPYMVMWWVPAGHVPSVVEAGERLEHLRVHGPTPAAFTFRNAFPRPETLAA